MKNTNLQLPEIFNNYIKEARSTDITVAVEDTCIIIACRCIINGRHYTASARCRVKDRMSKILHKILACLDEIKDTYNLDKPKYTRKKAVPENSTAVESQLKPVKTKPIEESTTPKRKRSEARDDPKFMVAGVTLQELANKVRVNRYARKMSAREYADKIGVGCSTLWYLEKGLRIPKKPDVVRRILAYTNGKNI